MVENYSIYDNRWDPNRRVEYTGNPNLEFNRDSSGSRWGDALIGLGQAAMSANPYNKPATYYMDINYKGNGLADSSIKPLQNYNYKNPDLWAEGLKSYLRQNKYRFGSGNDNTLADVFGKADTNKILGNIGVGNFVKESYPTSIYDNSWNAGNSIYNYQPQSFTYPGYLDGGQYGDFGRTVLDYFGVNNNIGGV